MLRLCSTCLLSVFHIFSSTSQLSAQILFLVGTYSGPFTRSHDKGRGKDGGVGGGRGIGGEEREGEKEMTVEKETGTYGIPEDKAELVEEREKFLREHLKTAYANDPIYRSTPLPSLSSPFFVLVLIRSEAKELAKKLAGAFETAEVRGKREGRWEKGRDADDGEGKEEYEVLCVDRQICSLPAQVGAKANAKSLARGMPQVKPGKSRRHGGYGIG
eukprot:764817-Hanusia_phi.AAC.3